MVSYSASFSRKEVKSEACISICFSVTPQTNSWQLAWCFSVEPASSHNLLGLTELLGHADEEDTSYEAFVGQVPEHQTERDVPTASLAMLASSHR